MNMNLNKLHSLTTAKANEPAKTRGDTSHERSPRKDLKEAEACTDRDVKTPQILSQGTPQHPINPALTSLGNESSTTAASYKDLAKANDTLRKEILKWKTMHEEERESARKRELNLTERINELRRRERAALSRQEDLARRLEHTERGYEMIVKAAESAAGEGEQSAVAAQMSILMDSHNKLSQSYDTLFQQLQEKTQELNQILENRRDLENQSGERIRAMENTLKCEQENADRARHQLAEMQQSHFQLVKSYREMNDRVIRFRQKFESGQISGKEPKTHLPIASTELPKSGTSSKGPRIRLTP